METPESARTVGLTKTGRGRIQRLKENGHFAEQVDAYRFALALALAAGVNPEPASGERVTMFNVGTLDPDGRIAIAVTSLADSDGEDPYRVAERLAEWGVAELERRVDAEGTVPAADLLKSIRELRDGAHA